MLETPGRLGLAIKALPQLIVRFVRSGDRFNGYKPINNGISGAVNHTHGPTAYFRQNFVFTELHRALSCKLARSNIYLVGDSRSLGSLMRKISQIEPLPPI
jgi:hypothetical protein